MFKFSIERQIIQQAQAVGYDVVCGCSQRFQANALDATMKCPACLRSAPLDAVVRSYHEDNVLKAVYWLGDRASPVFGG